MNWTAIIKSIPAPWIGVIALLIVIFWLVRLLEKKEDVVQKVADQFTEALSEQVVAMTKMTTLLDLAIKKWMA